MTAGRNKDEQKLKAAAVGAGIYGDVHIRAWQRHPCVELVRIWSRSQQRAQSTGEKYGVAYTTDLQQIADDERIDLVSIATPDFAHTEPAVMMLEAGKHVLLEKPMATTTTDCRKILDAARHGGGELMLNFHNRWYPPIAHAKRLVDAGELGQPVVAYARLSDQIVVPTEWLSWAGQSGPEWFLFPHLIDIIQWLLDQQVRRVFAAGRKGILQSRGVDCYDSVQAQLVLDDAIATIESSWVLPRSWRSIIDFKIDLLGSQGRIGIICDQEGVELTTNDELTTPFILDPESTEWLPFKHFVDCIIEGVAPTCTGQEGLKVTQVLEAIGQSLETAQAVSL